MARIYKCLHIPTSVYIFNGIPLTMDDWKEILLGHKNDDYVMFHFIEVADD